MTSSTSYPRVFFIYIHLDLTLSNQKCVENQVHPLIMWQVELRAEWFESMELPRDQRGVALFRQLPFRLDLPLLPRCVTTLSTAVGLSFRHPPHSHRGRKFSHPLFPCVEFPAAKKFRFLKNIDPTTNWVLKNETRYLGNRFLHKLLSWISL